MWPDPHSSASRGPQRPASRPAPSRPQGPPRTTGPQGGGPFVRPPGRWRFEELEIWADARDLAVAFHRVAAALDHQALHGPASQLRSAGGAPVGWIAEGSGGNREEFLECLARARGSLFAAASWLFVFRELGVLDAGVVQPLLERGEALGRRLAAFARRVRDPDGAEGGAERQAARGPDAPSGPGSR